MRTICNVCKDKETCSYIKQGKEGDCIDVQTSDYGYEEAVGKACKWLEEHLTNDKDPQRAMWIAFVKEFKKAMEE